MGRHGCSALGWHRCAGYTAGLVRTHDAMRRLTRHSSLRIPPTMMRPLTIAASFVLASLPLLASAQDAVPESTAPEATTTAAAPVSATAAPTTTAGDAARGRQLVYTCQGCHGVEGYKNAYPNYHVPKIGGQTESYLVVALTAYSKGERKHPTMQAQAESFSDQDIADIAAFLSSVK